MSTAEPTPATAQIPVINVSQIDIETADRLVDAAATFGFIFVELESTNIDYNSVQHMFQLSKKFFSSPRAEKEKCAISENNKGWSSMLSETLDPENQSRGDFKEALNFGEFKDGHAQQPLPDSLVADESTLNDFFTSCHNLCVRLLQLFAMGLKIDEEAGGKDWFSSRHDQSGPSGSILRLLHYPIIPSDANYVPGKDIRAGAHSDYGSITLLFQRPGQEGLEILSKGWQPVPVHPESVDTSRPPPILVNIGDLLSYWTGGYLRSTVHRVVVPPTASISGEDRYSMAFFCHPVDTALLVPVPSTFLQERGKKRGAMEAESQGKIITAAEHLRGRLAATYGWKK
ncbi:hypothetical protein TWF102_010202 [Orbilia oligospora]|uniref:Fe2OG dioxygenase domain-containing protein n=1 Tax=Orbilia oligospora TaxID=2813651 RepID=A0A7C8NIV4_ORBOL|nr:hypothetical protein TWF102_010202 [Orbilia oligospora]KAF3103293.1 hypothetical protein TWF103_007283 [Orbilia oligospora]KAF3105706.1 hypothetical protein TWF706_003806 [Orbilia oligospora]KAF3130386.1 hypothetical protein TWF594_010440 [Orbilia oligospora]